MEVISQGGQPSLAKFIPDIMWDISSYIICPVSWLVVVGLCLQPAAPGKESGAARASYQPLQDGEMMLGSLLSQVHPGRGFPMAFPPHGVRLSILPNPLCPKHPAQSSALLHPTASHHWSDTAENSIGLDLAMFPAWARRARKEHVWSNENRNAAVVRQQ